MDDDSAADDALGTDQLDQLVGGGADGVALAISLDVAKVTNVAVLVGGSTVTLAVRVDCALPSVSAPSRSGIDVVSGILTVRAGGGAAVGVVTEGVDVHATLSVGVVAADVP